MLLTFRVKIFVALLAHADELPLTGVRIVDAQREIRPVSQMLDMMHDARPPILPARFAELALVVVKLEQFFQGAQQ